MCSTLSLSRPLFSLFVCVYNRDVPVYAWCIWDHVARLRARTLPLSLSALRCFYTLLELRYYNYYYYYYCVLSLLIVFIFPCIMGFCSQMRAHTRALTCSPLYQHVNGLKCVHCTLAVDSLCFVLLWILLACWCTTADVAVAVAIILFYILHTI